MVEQLQTRIRKDRPERTGSRSERIYMETRGFGMGERFDLDMASDVLHTRHLLWQNKP